MKTQKQNICIVDIDKKWAYSLRKFLLNYFKNQVNIHLYFDGHNSLSRLHANVDITIVNRYDKKSGDAECGVEKEILQSIITRFPSTKVVKGSTQKEVSQGIESFCFAGETKILQPEPSSYKINVSFEKGIRQPINSVVAEYGLITVTVLFLFTSLLMGLLVKYTIDATQSW